MSYLSEIYWQQNNVEKGIDLAYKALSLAQKRKDKKTESNVYCNLSRLYKDWELYPQANEYANHAIETVLPTEDPQNIGIAYIPKAQVMQSMGIQDSAIFYYKKVKEFGDKAQIPNMRQQAESSIAELLIDHYEDNHLLAQGVHLIQEVLKEAPSNGGENSRYFYILGKGLIKQGNKSDGEAMLDSMYAAMNRIQGYKYAVGVLEYVIDYYLTEKNPAKVSQYTSIYRKQLGARYDEKISRKIVSAMIQFQTEKKEQQLKLATANLEVKDLKIKLYIIALILLILILIIVLLRYQHERKLQKNRNLIAKQEKLITLRERELAETRLQEQQQQLTNALENLRDANLQSEQVKEQLNDFLDDQGNKQSIVAITPAVFREKGEVKFRRYFVQLYPDFVNTLRNRIPDITRKEEVLCMLIVLDQNVDDMADILCVEKRSVKMSRYRFRKKTGLQQDESLDGFIKGLL